MNAVGLQILFLDDESGKSNYVYKVNLTGPNVKKPKLDEDLPIHLTPYLDKIVSTRRKSISQPSRVWRSPALDIRDYHAFIRPVKASLPVRDSAYNLDYCFRQGIFMGGIVFRMLMFP